MPAFNSASGAAAARKRHANRTRVSKETLLENAVFFEGFCTETARKLHTQLSGRETTVSREYAQTLAQIQRAWQGSVEKIALLKGIPAPGSRRPALQQSRRKRKPYATLALSPAE